MQAKRCRRMQELTSMEDAVRRMSAIRNRQVESGKQKKQMRQECAKPETESRSREDESRMLHARG